MLGRKLMMRSNVTNSGRGNLDSFQDGLLSISQCTVSWVPEAVVDTGFSIFSETQLGWGFARPWQAIDKPPIFIGSVFAPDVAELLA